MNIYGLKQRLIRARRFIKSERRKSEPNKHRIIRAEQGILNLKEKLRLMREENDRRKKGR